VPRVSFTRMLPAPPAHMETGSRGVMSLLITQIDVMNHSSKKPAVFSALLHLPLLCPQQVLVMTLRIAPMILVTVTRTCINLAAAVLVWTLTMRTLCSDVNMEIDRLTAH